MIYTKTTKEIDDVTYDAIEIDREDKSVPQAFTVNELQDIQYNTATHSSWLEEEKDERPEEYEYYLGVDEEGKSIIEKALEEQEQFLTECTLESVSSEPIEEGGGGKDEIKSLVASIA